uniref:Uncharacterized protein n=1 Tax=viral metagenome TaxID=1070528 RepID=A0A6C0H897_9ZZZZ
MFKIISKITFEDKIKSIILAVLFVESLIKDIIVLLRVLIYLQY